LHDTAAQAYSLNITVVPPGSLGFLTAYPTGQPLPLAATLNSLEGFIVGNAAIVPAGTSGSIDLYASSPTDVVIDINGCYAALWTASNNTALGPGALGNNTSGSFNTAAGSDTLQKTTTGSYNTATGSEALPVNTTGCLNIAAGALAPQFNTTGSSNTGVGYGALDLNTSGNGNTAIGYNALSANSTGGNNIAIGNAAAANVGAGNSGNIAHWQPGIFIGCRHHPHRKCRQPDFFLCSRCPWRDDTEQRRNSRRHRFPRTAGHYEFISAVQGRHP
jgi:hypothetical protein